MLSLASLATRVARDSRLARPSPVGVKDRRMAEDNEETKRERTTIFCVAAEHDTMRNCGNTVCELSHCALSVDKRHDAVRHATAVLVKDLLAILEPNLLVVVELARYEERNIIERI